MCSNLDLVSHSYSYEDHNISSFESVQCLQWSLQLSLEDLQSHILNNQELIESVSLDHLCTGRLLSLNFQAEVCFLCMRYVYALHAVRLKPTALH